MTVARRDGDVAVGRYIEAIAARMNARVTQVSAAIQAALEDDIIDLRGDARTAELLGASVEANVDTLLHALRHDLPVERIQAPAAAVEYARRLAQQGVPVHALVRAYRLGQRRLTEMVFAELHEMAIPPGDRISAIERITAIVFEYIDRITEQVVVIYDDERERWLETRNSLRALRVRELLTTRKAVDADETSTVIRYPLRWHHIALVLWYSDAGDSEIPRLQQFVRELAQELATDANPLFVAADPACAWAWLPYRAAPPDPAPVLRARAASSPAAPGIAIGRAGSGVAGFRRSHRQAGQAQAVAAAGGMANPVVAASDPGLAAAALLGDDLAETREWVGETLGELARDTDNDARLRETLRVFLRTGSSYKAAAEELDLHFNSVKYRVGRAVARRGRPIAQDRLDVELALLVCHWYGPVVLRPDPS
ncbi:helix-turn-helix domain-containing protein [Nocardia sp. NEAU-G5]|uniref:Helix-turn-helix domain-containing protein n=1 Tax=Nocardia albiluteola TaxID=2842303 RepID=A0ABS6B580_9NOCA|nr:helix-turn-helix domain-containing protein [Nocardia albiluteola]MBU3064935.1 helix-turn-helix domain-containing protein [Nocardia albiluteola]